MASASASSFVDRQWQVAGEGELDDHLLAVAGKEGQNTSHDECQEVEWVLHGDRDSGGFEAAIRV